jgi:hypothetical protein
MAGKSNPPAACWLIQVECEEGVAWGVPVTAERAEIKEWQERRWRHLRTC